MLVSDHNELEREYRDSLIIEGEQGANLYGVKCGAKASLVVCEDKRSSLGHLGNNGSANGQISFLCLSGRARWCLNNKVVLPSELSENVRLDWESDYEERERVIELFRLSRDYEGLVKELNSERIMINNVDLPCAVVNNDYDINIDDKYLPVGRSSVLVVADKCDNEVTHLGLTINTNGDLTKNTNSHMDYEKIIMEGNPMPYYCGTMEKINYYGYYTKVSHMMCTNEIEQCYVKSRLIFDDGG